MRIRSIKPEFWRSDDISALEWDERLLFVGLWSYVDDNGVGVDKLSSIAADLFASDLERNPPETFARVSRGLQQLATAGRIVRYTVESRPYLEVVNWDKHQRIDRPNKPRFPRSEANGAEIRDTLARVAAKEASGTGEQRNRGTEEQISPAPAVLDSEFAEAWEHWPKKVERKEAFERFKKAAKRIDVEELVAAIIRFGDAYAATTDRQFVPALGVWLNGDRWNDELPTARAQQQQRPTPAQQAASLVGTFSGPDDWMNAPSSLPSLTERGMEADGWT
ncbi:hypothetical protein [Curtobacterium sp. USHLN213]|uniref:hypothetical protein n=1 Tax=Curtobacterium sp. USHLN213 TaxID=3081255 RepID=UPI003015EA2A